jgi:hypothetical protein
MTEAEWLTCTDPAKMLEFLQKKGNTSERKLLLFGVACHYRLWHRITDESIKAIILATEQLADGQATYQELNAVYREASAGIYDAPHTYDYETALCDAWGTADMSDHPSAEAAGQAALLRDIFGNPFRPSAPPPACVLAWNDGAVVRLAQTIYDDRAFDRLPVLADTLEEAGCTDADILAHCRGPGSHVRGCWVVDLVLRRQ